MNLPDWFYENAWENQGVPFVKTKTLALIYQVFRK